jgi:hypothetical protein
MCTFNFYAGSVHVVIMDTLDTELARTRKSNVRKLLTTWFWLHYCLLRFGAVGKTWARRSPVWFKLLARWDTLYFPHDLYKLVPLFIIIISRQRHIAYWGFHMHVLIWKVQQGMVPAPRISDTCESRSDYGSWVLDGWQWSNGISQFAHVNLALAFDAPSLNVLAPQFISITGSTSNDPLLGCETKLQIHRACSCCTTSPLHLCPTSARWDQLWRLLRSSRSDFSFDHWRLSCTSLLPFGSTMSISRTTSCPN